MIHNSAIVRTFFVVAKVANALGIVKMLLEMFLPDLFRMSPKCLLKLSLKPFSELQAVDGLHITAIDSKNCV